MKKVDNIPFLFFRYRTCDSENGLVPNSSNNKRMQAVVIVADRWDCTSYSSSWMGLEYLSRVDSESDYTMVPDIDMADYEKIFVFDSDDAAKNETDAILKMKELWSKVGEVDDSFEDS